MFTDDDANINPYATFNELKLVFAENTAYHKADPDSEEDSVSLEKAQAKKAVSTRYSRRHLTSISRDDLTNTYQ